jgi:hypothetical protein
MEEVLIFITPTILQVAGAENSSAATIRNKDESRKTGGNE